MEYVMLVAENGIIKKLSTFYLHSMYINVITVEKKYTLVNGGVNYEKNNFNFNSY